MTPLIFIYNYKGIKLTIYIHVLSLLQVLISAPDSSLKTSLVAELPMDIQAYRLIDSFGPTGVPFQVKLYKKFFSIDNALNLF